jgi:hypothetical protein
VNVVGRNEIRTERKPRAYIAGPIFNEENLSVVNQIEDMLLRAGFEIFSPYRASREIWKGRKPADCSEQDRRLVLEGNISHLHWCDLLIARIGGTADGRIDTGTCWEMGYAHALNHDWDDPRPVTLAFQPDPDGRPLNLMLSGTVHGYATSWPALSLTISLCRDRGVHAIIGDALLDPTRMTQEQEPIR